MNHRCGPAFGGSKCGAMGADANSEPSTIAIWNALPELARRRSVMLGAADLDPRILARADVAAAARAAAAAARARAAMGQAALALEAGRRGEASGDVVQGWFNWARGELAEARREALAGGAEDLALALGALSDRLLQTQRDMLTSYEDAWERFWAFNFQKVTPILCGAAVFIGAMVTITLGAWVAVALSPGGQAYLAATGAGSGRAIGGIGMGTGSAISQLGGGGGSAISQLGGGAGTALVRAAGTLAVFGGVP